MQEYRNYKLRAYPNIEQLKRMKRNIGTCRYVYNYMLERNIKAYKRRGEYLSYNEMQNLLPKMKEYLPWLKEADSQALQHSCRHLDEAYKRFFKKESGFPRFHSKRAKQSYTTSGFFCDIKDNKVKLPKIGWVKAKNSFKLKDMDIKEATVTITPTGKVYITLCCKVDIPIKPNNGRAVALDMGIRSFYTDSNGYMCENPKYWDKSYKKLRRAERKLSRRTKGSNNYYKAKQRYALIHEKIANQRHDFLHKESTKLARENQTIYLEDISIKEMQSNKFVARNITNLGWYNFTKLLEYKTKECGGKVQYIDKDYPSSKVCNSCKTVKENLGTQRTWKCPACGKRHHRDINAAKNILYEGLRIVS